MTTPRTGAPRAARALLLTFAAAALAQGGCAREDGADRHGPELEGGVAISVGALGYAAVADAEYTLEVFNGDPDGAGALVVTAAALRSQRYGDGSGALSYVAPCDASTGEAVVRLHLDALFAADGAAIDPATYRDPTPLTRLVPCVADADTPVVFDITIMRRAEQGFFDIAVGFSDVFCSAKFDCRADDGGPIELLHDPLTERRGTTLVLGFACTAGGSSETWLRMSDVYVACGAGASATTYWLSPLGTRGGAEGNQGAVSPIFYETALYQGREQLPGVDKCYWNMAFGLSSAPPPDCRLVVDATASDASWEASAGGVPGGAVYPYIHYEIPLTNAQGALACGRHPLDGADDRVGTRYTDFGDGSFPYEWRCGDGPADEELGRITCAGEAQGVSAGQATFSQSPSGVSVTFGASRSQAYAMPDGLQLEGCCLNPCCDAP